MVQQADEEAIDCCHWDQVAALSLLDRDRPAQRRGRIGVSRRLPRPPSFAGGSEIVTPARLMPVPPFTTSSRETAHANWAPRASEIPFPREAGK